jgi:hypothetical protein
MTPPSWREVIATSEPSVRPTLEESLREVEDAIEDFETLGYQNAQAVLVRLVALLDREPVASLLRPLLSQVDFSAWWAPVAGTSMGVGTGSFDWPEGREARVAMQVELCRALSQGVINLIPTTFTFSYVSSRYDDNLAEFSRRVLRPMARDLARIADQHAPTPILAGSFATGLCPSGDEILDQLLESAVIGYLDKNPKNRRLALEKLWDAWERLKTIDEASGDKRRGVEVILKTAATDSAFHEVLRAEARALTDIGNRFHVRHFETDKAPLSNDMYVDYLFHRMWALVSLLINSRGAMHSARVPPDDATHDG